LSADEGTVLIREFVKFREHAIKSMIAVIYEITKQVGAFGKPALAKQSRRSPYTLEKNVWAC